MAYASGLYLYKRNLIREGFNSFQVDLGVFSLFMSSNYIELNEK